MGTWVIMQTIRGVGFAAVAATTVLVASSVAAEQRSIGTFRDWSAFTDTVGGNKVCYAGSLPKKQEGDYTRRGDTYILVTHRPADAVVGEVSVEAGYSYQRGSEATATIDGRSFQLFTEGGNAWAYDEAADREMVRAMRAGAEMVIKGTSSRGTLTSDTYSLFGFTAAYKAITDECQ